MILQGRSHPPGSSSGDIWPTADIGVAFPPHTARHRKRVSVFSPPEKMIFCICFGPRSACTGTSALMFGEGQACCSCVGAARAVSVTHLHFYVSVWGWLFLLLRDVLRGLHYISSALFSVCWKTAAFVLTGSEAVARIFSCRWRHSPSHQRLYIYVGERGRW